MRPISFVSAPRPTPPIRPHAELQRWMSEYRRRPLHGMNLRHQGCVDQPGGLEQLLVVPVRKLELKPIADGIVFEREQSVQDLEPDPPIGGESGGDDLGRWVHRQQPCSVRNLPPSCERSLFVVSASDP